MECGCDDWQVYVREDCVQATICHSAYAYKFFLLLEAAMALIFFYSLQMAGRKGGDYVHRG